MKEGNLPKGVTKEQAEAWREKWGKLLKLIVLPLDDVGEQVLEIVAHVPDRKTLGNWEKFADSNPDKSKEILIRACVIKEEWVDQILEDDELFRACSVALMKIVPTREAEIKNF